MLTEKDENRIRELIAEALRNCDPSTDGPPLKVEEFAEIMDIGRTLAWELVRAGAVRTIKIGRFTRIPRSEIKRIREGVPA